MSAEILRAMVTNYSRNNLWDHLDAKACSDAADEIESLRAQIAELKAENERLRMALADTEALEIGTAERCSKLTCQRDEYKAVLENLLEVVDEPPERNCSCHIAPPCNDCVNWSGLREALSDARTAAKGATE